MDIVVVIGYMLALSLIFLFSMGQFHLALQSKKKSRERSKPRANSNSLPMVTVQLPIYNELYVTERLIDQVCQFSYPKDKLEIQVLDDSTDETVTIIEKRVALWQTKGVDIQHIRRSDRTGYKAGALKYGMEMAKGAFIAIFDADFLPPRDFLTNTLPYFEDPNIGVVQSRWGHINENYSVLTKMQAFGLDAHFVVEQKGRNLAGSFINFNGTAGVWRKRCIEDAGGWSADTLTEDLDLSYRAQLNGWKFHFEDKVIAPAELPVVMSAVKSQQYRWNKGAAETARKNLKKVLSAPLKLSQKIHATFHLLNSSVFPLLLVAALLSVPMLFIKEAHPEFGLYFDLGSIFLIGFVAISYFYWISNRRTHPAKSFRHYLATYPFFLSFSMGMSLHNAVAVTEGLLGYKTPFIRTPKFNILEKNDTWMGNKYLKKGITPLTVAEAGLSLYFIYGIISGFQLEDYGLMIFHIMLALGFGGVFFYSIRTVNGGS